MSAVAEAPTRVDTSWGRLRDAAALLARQLGGSAHLTAAERADVIATIDRITTILATARAELLVTQRESGAWRNSGDASFEAWRARTSRSGLRASSTEVRRGDVLQAMPRMRDAATAGDVTLEHVDAIAKVTRNASPPVRDALTSADGQSKVLELARRAEPGQFARSLAHMAAEIDAGAHERSHQNQRTARFLNLADVGDGTRITGLLDHMAGHRLRLALEAASARPAQDDERTGEQRRADALETIADKMLSLPDTASGAAVRPHVSFLMSAETWAALRTDHRARSDADGASGGPAEGPAAGPAEGSNDGGAPPVTLEDGTAVPPSEVARVLCDCELTRIVIGTGSEPLNLGRTARTYTGSQRRAVIIRDGACAWPSCDMHARWCETHHIRWWDRDGGETSVENGVLLCSFHHHEVHRQTLTIRREKPDDNERGPDGRPRARYTFLRPDGRRMGEPQDRDTAAARARLTPPANHPRPSERDAGDRSPQASSPSNPISQCRPTRSTT